MGVGWDPYAGKEARADRRPGGAPAFKKRPHKDQPQDNGIGDKSVIVGGSYGGSPDD